MNDVLEYNAPYVQSDFSCNLCPTKMFYLDSIALRLIMGRNKMHVAEAKHLKRTSLLKGVRIGQPNPLGPAIHQVFREKLMSFFINFDRLNNFFRSSRLNDWGWQFQI